MEAHHDRIFSVVSLGEARKRRASVAGRFEGVVEDQLVGWAWCPDAPTERVGIEVLLDGRTLGSTVADQQRGDLRGEGIGDGAHGFSYRLPDDAGLARQQLIEVRAGPARIPLDVAHRYGLAATASTRQLRPARYTAVPAAAPPPPEAAQLGDEGWLFPLYDPRSSIGTEDQIHTAAERYEHLCRTLSEIGVPYILAIAPNKQDVYPQLAAGARSAHPRFVRLMRSELLDSKWPDPFDLLVALMDARRHGVLYPRSDSNWNARGAFYATHAVIREVAKRVPEAAPLPLDRARGVSVDGFRGNLIELPRFGPDKEPVESTPMVEATLEADVASLRSIQMPAPVDLPLPGHPAPLLFQIADEPQLPRLALMGVAMVDQLLQWFPEHSRRTLVCRGHEPPLEQLELESPDAIVHVVTAAELLAGT